MRKTSSFPAFLFCVILAAGCAVAYALSRSAAGGIGIACVAFVVALVVATTTKVAAPWDRSVVLRVGRFRALRGPGVFGIIPIIDTIPYWIDTRVITTSFKAEKPTSRRWWSISFAGGTCDTRRT